MARMIGTLCFKFLVPRMVLQQVDDCKEVSDCVLVSEDRRNVVFTRLKTKNLKV